MEIITEVKKNKKTTATFVGHNTRTAGLQTFVGHPSDANMHPPCIPQFRDLKCGSREANKVHMWSLPPSAALTGGGTINRTAEPVDLPSTGKIKRPNDKEKLTSFLKQ